MLARGPLLALAIVATAGCGRSSGEEPGADDVAPRDGVDPGERDRGGDVSDPIRDEGPGEPGPEVVFRPNGRPEARVAVEVMRTPRQIQRGLMYRAHLPPDQGMLFVFPRAGERRFWMKNTLVPLDMVFIGPDGKIGRIAANTVPMSLDPVPSIDPVSAVLEIAGGRAAELGIKDGDKVSWPH